MKTVYIDCSMGAAGDMLTAALSELLPNADAFFEKMNHIGLPDIVYEKQAAVKCGITGTHVSVKVHGVEEGEHEHSHEHEHEHHHEHGEECTCGCHDHDHHHHHADEVFTSWGVETAKKFDKAAVEAALKELDTGKYGMVLRAKGILPAADGSWIHFDYVPEESNVRTGSADIIGKLCVIATVVAVALILVWILRKRRGLI